MGFDIDSFSNTPFHGRTDTRRAVCPVKPEGYIAIIVKQEPRAPYEEGKRPTLEVHCAPQGYEGPPVRYTCWLDVLADGTLDPADYKNAQLGQLREAVGQNWTDRPWTPAMLEQATLRIQVTHRKGKDGTTYDQVGAVAAVGAAQPAVAAVPLVAPPVQAVAPVAVAPATPPPIAAVAPPAAPVVAPAAPVAPVVAPVGGNAAAAAPLAPAAPAAAPQAPLVAPSAWGS